MTDSSVQTRLHAAGGAYRDIRYVGKPIDRTVLERAERCG